MMDFYSPWILLLLLLLPLPAILVLRRKRTAGVRFSSLGDMKKCPVSWRLKFKPILLFLRLLCLALLIVALARPREGTELSNISTEGVAMEIVVDRSGSMGEQMNYQGEKLNRLEVVKRVLKNFIGGGDDFQGRSEDMIGLVSFARYADTVCPLIHGHDVLLEFLKKTEIVRLRSEDGTAIGDAIALAAARLKKAEAQIERRNAKLRASGVSKDKGDNADFEIKSKVIVLLTDGQNNAGRHSPIAAAKLAKEWGIKIYTIGIGSDVSAQRGQSFFGAFFAQGPDERLLKAIAEATGGFYAFGGSGEDILEIYKKIDKLEKSEVRSVQYTQYAEQFGPWAFAGLCVLGLEILAGCTLFRKIP